MIRTTNNDIATGKTILLKKSFNVEPKNSIETDTQGCMGEIIYPIYVEKNITAKTKYVIAPLPNFE